MLLDIQRQASAQASGDIVLDMDPAPRKGAQPPLFGPLGSGTVAHLSNC